MRNFRTIVDITESEHKISHQTGLVFMGSCFSESIGQKLVDYKIPVDLNPFGVLYNPASIAESLDILISKKIFTEDDLHFANERWFSFYHHSDFSHQDKNTCLELINSRIHTSHGFLKNAGYLFITLGTSWVFSLASTGKVVSNCHKIPPREFIRQRLCVDEITKLLKKSLDELRQFNPNIKIVFTISPIRHWKDGAHGNQVSKAGLLLAVEKLVVETKQLAYFPSYEIMMDDLRDYRFYESDMLHISPLAVDYIFDAFAGSYFSSATKNLNQEIEKIVKATKHKAFNPKSKSYIGFLESNIETIEKLETKNPNLNFNLEKNYFISEKKIVKL